MEWTAGGADLKQHYTFKGSGNTNHIQVTSLLPLVVQSHMDCFIHLGEICLEIFRRYFVSVKAVRKIYWKTLLTFIHPPSILLIHWELFEGYCPSCLNLESPITLTLICMSLDCERKPEYLEETHTERESIQHAAKHCTTVPPAMVMCL